MDVEVAVPWEGGCPHRERALAWLKPRLEELYPTRLVDQSPNFAKSRAVNTAARECEAEVLVVCDADCWSDGLPVAVEAVKRGAAWAMPHTYVRRLSKSGTEDWIAGERDVRKLTLVEPPYKGAKGGGIFVVRREVLLDVVWDERYVGWGRQDLSWRAAMTTLHGNPWRGRDDLIHLWHPPEPRRGRTRSLSDESEELYARYVAARGDEWAIRELLEEARCFMR